VLWRLYLRIDQKSDEKAKGQGAHRKQRQGPLADGLVAWWAMRMPSGQPLGIVNLMHEAVGDIAGILLTAIAFSPRHAQIRFHKESPNYSVLSMLPFPERYSEVTQPPKPGFLLALLKLQHFPRQL
jgi:hypothetical protein